MTPLERAAAAVREVDGAYPVARTAGEPAAWMTEGGVVSDEHFHDIARAVLQAIREPSGDMVTTAMSMHGDITGPAVELVWQAMIDRALSE